MSFNPFGGFPTTLTAIPAHFAVGKFQQAQDQLFVSNSSAQGLQIAVSTVDTSQLGGNLHSSNLNGHVHVPTSSPLQIQNHMLNTLLAGRANQNDVFVKVETEGEENDRFHSSQQDKNNTSAQQDISSLSEYLTRFSGQPTFPYQQMFKYPADLVQLSNTNDIQQQQHNMMADNSPQIQTPEQQPQVWFILNIFALFLHVWKLICSFLYIKSFNR